MGDEVKLALRINSKVACSKYQHANTRCCDEGHKYPREECALHSSHCPRMCIRADELKRAKQFDLCIQPARQMPRKVSRARATHSMDTWNQQKKEAGLNYIETKTADRALMFLGGKNPGMCQLTGTHRKHLIYHENAARLALLWAKKVCHFRDNDDKAKYITLYQIVKDYRISEKEVVQHLPAFTFWCDGSMETTLTKKRLYSMKRRGSDEVRAIHPSFVNVFVDLCKTGRLPERDYFVPLYW